jgi:hypothetical protein
MIAWGGFPAPLPPCPCFAVAFVAVSYSCCIARPVCFQKRLQTIVFNSVVAAQIAGT